MHVVHRSVVLADPIIHLIVETPPVSVRMYYVDTKIWNNNNLQVITLSRPTVTCIRYPDSSSYRVVL